MILHFKAPVTEKQREERGGKRERERGGRLREREERRERDEEEIKKGVVPRY